MAIRDRTRLIDRLYIFVRFSNSGDIVKYAFFLSAWVEEESPKLNLTFTPFLCLF